MTYQHGLINYKDTKPELSSLLVFNKVYRLEIVSVMLVFSTSFVNYCPSNLLSGSLGGLRNIKHLLPSPFTGGQFFKITAFGIAFYESNLSKHNQDSCLVTGITLVNICIIYTKTTDSLLLFAFLCDCGQMC